jgi:serine-type D-Ala-D-Ala endopeptidase (penicillin-binding protein 7)
MRDTEERPFDDNRPGNDGRQQVQQGAEQKAANEERIGGDATGVGPAECHDPVFPGRAAGLILEKHLDVPANPLDPGMKRKRDLERGGEHEERDERDDRRHGQPDRRQCGRRPSNGANQDHPYPGRAPFPDRRAKGVVFIEIDGRHGFYHYRGDFRQPIRRISAPNAREIAIDARGTELVRAQLGSTAVSDLCIETDNSLAVYQLSGYNDSASTTSYSFGTTLVSRKPFFWIGHLALAGLVSLAGVPTASAQTASKPATKSASSTRPAAKRTTRARRPTAAQRRAAATAQEMADTVVPRYKVDAGGNLVPDLRAAAAIIYDPDTNEVLWEENSETERSIASITKVMTAAVVFENNPDLSHVVTIARSDVARASTTHLRLNDKVTIGDLLHLTLIASDNAAARALARSSQQGSAGFIDRMNEKALELGLTTTHYADPSGLLSENVSSAFDMARLIAFASSDERISTIMQKSQYTIQTSRRGPVTFRSTNHLLGREGLDVRAGKTGFISKWRSLSLERARTPAASWKCRTCSTGSRRRLPRCSPLRLSHLTTDVGRTF